MNLSEITVLELVTAMGWLALVLTVLYFNLWLTNKIINWVWWKKEYRKDFHDWKYFVKHRQEVLDCIHKRESK